jgi:hypothetical protein
MDQRASLAHARILCEPRLADDDRYSGNLQFAANGGNFLAVHGGSPGEAWKGVRPTGQTPFHLDRGADRAEQCAQLRAERREDGDQHEAEHAGDDAVFERGHGAVVILQADDLRNNCLHNTLHLCAERVALAYCDCINGLVSGAALTPPLDGVPIS